MAKLKNGIFGAFIGRLGNISGYIRRGQSLARVLPRKLKKSKRKRSTGQKQVNSKFQFTTKTLKPFNPLFNIGFEIAAKGGVRTAQNEAFSDNIKNAIKGEAPDFYIDYPNLMLTKGKLPQAENTSVELTDEGLKFKWDKESSSWESSRDRVIMCAYSSLNQAILFHDGSAYRSAGEDILEISKKSNFLKGNIEVYISFISNNRKQIANSKYLGSIAL